VVILLASPIAFLYNEFSPEYFEWEDCPIGEFKIVIADINTVNVMHQEMCEAFDQNPCPKVFGFVFENKVVSIPQWRTVQHEAAHLCGWEHE